jgi:uncharacterized protein
LSCSSPAPARTTATKLSPATSPSSFWPTRSPAAATPSLRFDKRGIASSTGDYATATTEDFASDAEAAITYLKTRRDLNMKKFGIVGHSEGGIIGPLLAVRSPQQISWLVLLAAPALKGEDTLLLQSKLIAQAGGLSDTQIASSLAFDRKAYSLVREEHDPAELEKKLHDLVRVSGLAASLPPPALQSQIRLISSPWFRFFLDYDAEHVRQLGGESPLDNLMEVK